MSTPTSGTAGTGTTAADYSQSYYASHLGGDDYGWETDAWREFFVRVATRVRAITEAGSVLDVGCARGLFVQALRLEGVDAKGFDVSDHAVTSAHPDVRDHLWVQSATEAIEGRYDLVSCIEVLEHMAPDEADQAIDRMCAVSDHVLFSSGPGDFTEPTHINVRPTAEWVTAFAERGFFRRTDVNLDFLTTWAVLLSRQPLTPRDVTARYEGQYAALHEEVVEKRAALLEAHREVARLHMRVNDPDAEVRLEQSRAAAEKLSAEVQGELNQARRELALREKSAETAEKLVVSLDARIAELSARLRKSRTAQRASRRQLRETRKRLRSTRRQLGEQRTRARRAEQRLGRLTASRTYRLAGRLSSPGRAWRRFKGAVGQRRQDGGASQ